MKTYEITYWEKESVWVERRTIVKTKHDLNKAIEDGDEQLLKEVIEDNAVDYAQADYNWETVEHEDYDFDEVMVEEVEDDEE